MIRQKANHGFTLVEMLVVISIIAMLASIVLSSLANARQQAYNSTLIQEIVQYRDALELYRSSANTYPILSDNAWHCLGSYPGHVCGWVGLHSGPPEPSTESAELITDLAPYISNVPVNVPPIALQRYSTEGAYVGTDYYSGVTYVCNGSANGVCQNAAMMWYLTGSQSCVAGTLGIDISGNTLCLLNLTGSVGSPTPP